MAYRKSNERGLTLEVRDQSVNQLFKHIIEPCAHQDGFQLAELNKNIFLCLFASAKANASKCSSIMKFDANLKLQMNIGLDFAIMHDDVHQDKLYLLAASSDRNSRHIYVYDESLKMLEKIQLGISEGLSFYVPTSVTKMKITEEYFVFNNGTNVLLMDRLNGEIKRTLSIGSSDFALDSRNNRIIAHDAKLGRLVCFDFEGESFEISSPMLTSYELVDLVHDRFVLLNPRWFIYLI
jgi:hypothetical protein